MGTEKLTQPFDEFGNMGCIACPRMIVDGDVYLEVRQRDCIDTDSKLAIHAACFLITGLNL